MSFGIWNNLDEAALYLGLERLDGEVDEELCARIKKFGKWRYKTDYYTQVHSIPLQVGLGTKNLLEITSVKRFECKIDWEHFTIESFNDDGTSSEYVRVFINTPFVTISKVSDLLDQSLDFKCNIYNPQYKSYLFKNIIRHTNVFIETAFINSSNYNFLNGNIIKGTLRFNDDNIFNREVGSLQDLGSSGDYFVDYTRGYIQSYDNIKDGIYATYRRFNDRFILEHTDINLQPLNVISKYGVTDDLIDLMPYLLNGKTWGI